MVGHSGSSGFSSDKEQSCLARLAAFESYFRSESIPSIVIPSITRDYGTWISNIAPALFLISTIDVGVCAFLQAEGRYFTSFGRRSSQSRGFITRSN